jgi:hypothetical protein
VLAAGDHDAVLLALGSLGPAAFVRGRFTEAEGEAALRRSVALARAEQSPARLRFGLTVLAASLLLEGRLEDARGALQEAEAAAMGSPTRSCPTWPRSWRGRRESCRGWPTTGSGWPPC